METTSIARVVEYVSSIWSVEGHKLPIRLYFSTAESSSEVDKLANCAAVSKSSNNSELFYAWQYTEKEIEKFMLLTSSSTSAAIAASLQRQQQLQQQPNVTTTSTTSSSFVDALTTTNAATATSTTTDGATVKSRKRKLATSSAPTTATNQATDDAKTKQKTKVAQPNVVGTANIGASATTTTTSTLFNNNATSLPIAQTLSFAPPSPPPPSQFPPLSPPTFGRSTRSTSSVHFIQPETSRDALAPSMASSAFSLRRSNNFIYHNDTNDDDSLFARDNSRIAFGLK